MPDSSPLKTARTATNTTLGSATTVAPSTATVPPSTSTVPPTTTTPPTTNTPTPNPEPVAAAFVKALYKWSHTEYSLPTTDKIWCKAALPTPHRASMPCSSGVNAAPATDANITDSTPGAVSLNRSMLAAPPTASTAVYIARVAIANTTTTTKGSFVFNAEAQVALHLTARGWKVTAMDASGVNGPSYSGPAANAHVRIADPAYGAADQQPGISRGTADEAGGLDEINPTNRLTGILA